MAQRDERQAKDIAAARAGPNDSGPPRQAGAHYGFCGSEVNGSATGTRRFGEVFCGEEHAEAFAGEMRSARAAAIAMKDGAVAGAAGAGEADTERPARAASGWSLKQVLTMAISCGAPILALVFLAGGGGAWLGAGAAILPVLALLACPLGMFFVMRAMADHQKEDEEVGTRPVSSTKAKKQR